MGTSTPILRDSDGKTFSLDKQYAEQCEIDARARRVVLVDSSGNIIKSVQIEENRLGSECSGSDGATDRILTLTNTNESGGPVSIWIEGQLVSQSDLTITHNSSSSTIQVSIQIYNTDNIKVLYYI